MNKYGNLRYRLQPGFAELQHSAKDLSKNPLGEKCQSKARVYIGLPTAFVSLLLFDISDAKLLFIGAFSREMYLISNKTEKNRKKPVETKENRLTKRPERLKVNCGTVLRTRMNTDDSHWKVGAAFVDNRAGQASGPMKLYF
jgi:hypothetical protein